VPTQHLAPRLRRRPAVVLSSETVTQQQVSPPAFSYGSSSAQGPRPTMEDELCLRVNCKDGFTFAGVRVCCVPARITRNSLAAQRRTPTPPDPQRSRRKPRAPRMHVPARAHHQAHPTARVLTCPCIAPQRRTAPLSSCV
jgi:hypothetical protein